MWTRVKSSQFYSIGILFLVFYPSLFVTPVHMASALPLYFPVEMPKPLGAYDMQAESRVRCVYLSMSCPKCHTGERRCWIRTADINPLLHLRRISDSILLRYFQLGHSACRRRFPLGSAVVAASAFISGEADIPPLRYQGLVNESAMEVF